MKKAKSKVRLDADAAVSTGCATDKHHKRGDTHIAPYIAAYVSIN